MRNRNGRSPVKIIAALLPITLLLTGCWDRLEIEERAVVLGIGIDKAEPDAEKKEEEVTHLKGRQPVPKRGMVRITVQLAVPGRIPLGPGEGGGGSQGGGGGHTSVWVISEVGHTIEDAINNLQQRIAPQLFFGHLRVIIVSEAIAKKGISNLNDYFRRNPEVRRMNWMIICKGSARDLLKAAPELERVPALYLLRTMDQAVIMGRLPETFLGIFWSNSSARGREGFLPYIELKENDTIHISGLAYFKGTKMVGATKPLEIPFYMAIKGIPQAGGEAFVKVPGSKSDFVVFNSTNRRSKIRVKIKDGRPHVYVDVQVEGNLIEKSNERFLLNEHKLSLIKRQLEENSLKSLEALIAKTQEKGSDIFGFGENVRAKESRYWNRHIKSKEEWQRIYKDLPVHIAVELNIRRVGMKAR